MSDVITPSIASLLVKDQFPHWADLPVFPVKNSGWDNQTFRLGQQMTLRFPSAAEYASQVEKEQKWLPFLASKLPLIIPTPLGLGKPGVGYKWHWSVYNWIEGESATTSQQVDKMRLARNLADFLLVLYQLETKDGPIPGKQNFHRGGNILVYEKETFKALKILEPHLKVKIVKKIWDSGTENAWNSPPVWVHGDISIGNLILENGYLKAVIDFGLLSIGDPACDLAIAWTFFDSQSRKVFRDRLSLDNPTWRRGRAWALWKSLVILSGLSRSNNIENALARGVIWQVIEDYKLND